MFADFAGNYSSLEVQICRRKPQETADFRRNPFVPLVCPFFFYSALRGCQALGERGYPLGRSEHSWGCPGTFGGTSGEPLDYS